MGFTELHTTISVCEARDKDLNPSLLADLTKMIESGRLTPPPPKSFRLEEAGEVLTALTERRLAGKAVLLTR